jgi:hypothetical protein
VIQPQNERYGFTVFGEGFNSNEADNAISIDTADGPILFADSRTRIFSPPCPPEKPPERNGCAVPFAAAKHGALTVTGIPASKLGGRRKFSILAGHNVISNEAEVRFATSHDERSVAGLGIGLFIGFLVIPVLVTGVLTKWRRLGIWFVRAVMDEGARRFSLSRLQLFAWMWTCLLGLFASTLQVGETLPALPSGLLGLAVLSIATSASSSVISHFRSSGGAAQVEATPSDLICDFGLVLWERVLFVGCTAASIAYTAGLMITSVDSAGSDPLDTPIWLVLVNGLCALVYIAGKCVRSSGPRINQVFTEEGSLDLTITGANLSGDAYFGLNGTLLPPQLIALNRSSGS